MTSPEGKASLVMIEWDAEGNLAAIHSSTGRVYRPSTFDELRRVFSLIRDEPDQKAVKVLPNWRERWETLVVYCATSATPEPLRPILHDAIDHMRPMFQDAISQIFGDGGKDVTAPKMTVVQTDASRTSSPGHVRAALPGRVANPPRQPPRTPDRTTEIHRVTASRPVRRRDAEEASTPRGVRRIRRKGASS